MNTARVYYDEEGRERTIHQMVKENPHWAANRLQEGEKAIERVAQLEAEIDRLKEWLEWISEHTGITECNVPGDEFPYLNMPPNEGANAALNGDTLEDCESK